jgi:hypothetical protein
VITSMTAAPRALHARDGRSASNVDRLLATVWSELRFVPQRVAFEPIDMVGCLALHARRQHRMDLAAANATLRAALDELGNPHRHVSPASIVRRIELHYRHNAPRLSAGGGR